MTNAYYAQKWAIGNLSLNSRLILAPLAGVSAAPYRSLAWRYGGLAYAATEMLAGGSIAVGARQKQRYQYRAPNENRLCYQFAAGNPQVADLVMPFLCGLSADIIELNCGCPVNKIRSKGQGSRLLEQPKKLYEILSLMREKVPDRVIGLKVRLLEDPVQHLNILNVAQDAGMDYMAVHGRTWRDSYAVACGYDAIADIVAAAEIPIIGNGDIKDLATLEAMRQTGCDGYMIGRHAVGRPWLCAKLQSEAIGNTYKEPTLHERLALLLEHVHGIAGLDGERAACFQGRMLAKYYTRDHRDRCADILVNLQSVETLPEYTTVVAAYTE